MPVPTLYLDTTVLGGRFDDEWKDPTHELWRQMEAGQWRFFTSLVAAEELPQAPERVRDLFQRSFTPEKVFDVTEEMDQLAAAHLAQGVITPTYAADARHVAVCTVARHDYLLIWNFRHLVKLQHSAGFNAVNLLQGWPPVLIVNGLEIIYGNQDQDV